MLTKTGHRVAILVDEYDKPLLQNIGNDTLQDELRGFSGCSIPCSRRKTAISSSGC